MKKIVLKLNEEPEYSRFLEGSLEMNGEPLPATAFSLEVSQRREVLIIEIPLAEVEIYSEPSKPVLTE